MPRRYWTHAEEQRLRELFAQPGLRTAAMAPLLGGRTEGQITAKAWSMGLTRDAAARLKPATVRAREAVLRAAASPDGIAVGEVSGQSAHAVQVAVTGLLKVGKLFRAKLSHRYVRYFTDAQAAATYELEHRRAAPVVAQRSVGRAPWPDDTPTHWPRDASGRELWKTTVAPPPPERPLRTNTWAL